ncbi:hypothetical protein [Paralysiella testudinis]|uniref:Uncharacterized protein n=1 Tax=Paralysiella testudinis TaxID=2809020 RepID=A0A892ZKE5_9NEIS|nr:hypothetical protein [Paralysiella testudinis]QRQ82888.1 hypothetical protein JQU52_05810 [Paralysiella testudinis]
MAYRYQNTTTLGGYFDKELIFIPRSVAAQMWEFRKAVFLMEQFTDLLQTHTELQKAVLQIDAYLVKLFCYYSRQPPLDRWSRWFDVPTLLPPMKSDLSAYINISRADKIHWHCFGMMPLRALLATGHLKKLIAAYRELMLLLLSDTDFYQCVDYHRYEIGNFRFVDEYLNFLGCVRLALETGETAIRCVDLLPEMPFPQAVMDLFPIEFRPIETKYRQSGKSHSPLCSLPV